MQSKIIIMLTHNDQTVPNALEVFESCKDLPVELWGFKDVGLPRAEMERLIGAMKAAGKQTFLEVVTYTEQQCLDGARLAVELGFDYLLGTIYFPRVVDYLRDKPIRFMPFCGTVSGSPSVLQGEIPAVIADARRLLDLGVYGIDLLAFRHQEGAKLARACCAALDKPVVVAGSISDYSRIDFIGEINPWAFTMGSALFTANFVPNGDFRANLQQVLAYLNKVPAPAPAR